MVQDKNVRNVRFGLATNSSSTHSIIHNHELATAGVDTDVGRGEFGWDFFTAASKDARKVYMLQQLKSNLPHGTLEAMKFMAKEMGFFNKAAKMFEGYIDHQSVMQLPKSRHYKDTVNMDFFSDYYDYIVNGDFIILGGNDNDDDSHPLSCDGGEVDSHFWDFENEDTAWKNGNYWVVMSGARKLRIKFEDGELSPEKPELIDIKITDFCDIGCDFCYQGSTEEGMHGDYDVITKLLGKDYTEAVYEFAIGGGEPTAHPDFAKIVEYIHKRGYIANFTTKSLKWMDDEEKLSAVKGCVSGIAYSAQTLESAKIFITAHDENVGLDAKLYLHVIPELMTEEELTVFFVGISELNNTRRYGNKISVTLLGYKTTGRGASQNPGKMKNMIKILMNTRYVPIGIDTKIAVDYADELQESGVRSKLYTSEEGMYSMYVDAVEQKAYKSSYELDKPIELMEQGRRYGIGVNSLKDMFASIRSVG